MSIFRPQAKLLKSNTTRTTPGLWVASLWILVIYGITGYANQWWQWLIGLAIWTVMDTRMGFHSVYVPADRESEEFVHDSQVRDRQ